MKIEFDEFTPIFFQVISFIKIQIITGVMKSGTKIPSVRELAKKFEINPNTVQKSYQELERVGLLRSERGSGNYITEDLNIITKAKNEMANEAATNYIEKMNSYGYSPEEIIDIINKYLGGCE
ncbi:MAG: GntR family transcriptional regulator [Clostridium sp.]|uniref:GntR family transcriptional regulator n=1 Tax=Clostridium sp. TaxID=1506 RepID=UPI003D6CF03A